MIDGITILSQKMIEAPPDWISIIVIVSFIVCIVGGLIVTVGIFIDSSTLSDVGTFIGGIALIIVFIFFLISCICKKPTGRYEYKVITNNPVSLQQIYSEYNVVDVEGMIYTIRDKKNE